MIYTEWNQHIAANLIRHHREKPLSPRGQQMMQEALGEHWESAENLARAEAYAEAHPGLLWWKRDESSFPAPPPNFELPDRFASDDWRMPI